MIFTSATIIGFLFVQKEIVLLLLNLEMMVIIAISMELLRSSWEISFFIFSMTLVSMGVLGATVGISSLSRNMRFNSLAKYFLF